MLSSIRIAAFFGYQYDWKDWMDVFQFLHGNTHQGKVATETTNFGWVYAQTCLHLPRFRQDSNFELYTKMFSCPARLQDSLITDISGRKQLLSQIFCIVLVTKERYYVIILLQIGCGQTCPAISIQTCIKEVLVDLGVLWPH